MKYLLDTHIWIWLLDCPEKLSPAAASVIKDRSAGSLGVADISAWEVARKESLGKLTLTLSSRVWLRQATQSPGLEMIRADGEIAWESCHLPGDFHRDPADQMIVATARILGLVLITRDERLLNYPGVETLW
jgi:PIN domain nuclease of toxin-antitoxin system